MSKVNKTSLLSSKIITIIHNAKGEEVTGMELNSWHVMLKEELHCKPWLFSILSSAVDDTVFVSNEQKQRYTASLQKLSHMDLDEVKARRRLLEERYHLIQKLQKESKARQNKQVPSKHETNDALIEHSLSSCEKAFNKLSSVLNPTKNQSPKKNPEYFIEAASQLSIDLEKITLRIIDQPIQEFIRRAIIDMGAQEARNLCLRKRNEVSRKLHLVHDLLDSLQINLAEFLISLTKRMDTEEDVKRLTSTAECQCQVNVLTLESSVTPQEDEKNLDFMAILASLTEGDELDRGIKMLKKSHYK